MSAAKHTPGPWTWDDEYPITVRAHGLTICALYPAQAGDARLIAAAPAMAEALRAIAAEASAVGGAPAYHIRTAARAALKQAGIDDA